MKPLLIDGEGGDTLFAGHLPNADHRWQECSTYAD